MGSDGVEPPETEATSFTDWPAIPYGITPQDLNEINFIKHWRITLNMIMS